MVLPILQTVLFSAQTCLWQFRDFFVSWITLQKLQQSVIMLPKHTVQTPYKLVSYHYLKCCINRVSSKDSNPHYILDLCSELIFF